MSFFTNTSINTSTATVLYSSEYCLRFQNDGFQKSNFSITLASIILNTLSCPVIIVMNALVIAAVKTKRTLQSESNILLASLAGTDFLTGAVILPVTIAPEIFHMTGGSVKTYCSVTKNIVSPLRFLSVLTSLFQLVLISFERQIALKYHLRYYYIVSRFRLGMAITFSWLLASAYTLFKLFIVSSLHTVVLQVMTVFSVAIIVYCHASVFLVTRRHERRIRTEQFPAGEETERFLKAKKAWKTTGIIIGFVVLSFLPGFFVNFGVMFNFDQRLLDLSRPLVHSCLMLNSLCNPIIYCFRIRIMREAMLALLKPRER